MITLYELMFNSKESLTFDDFIILPSKITQPTNEIQINYQIDYDVQFDNPFISAPMDTVTDHTMAHAMHKSGGLGVIHYNQSIDSQVGMLELVRKQNPNANLAAAVSTHLEDRKRIDQVTQHAQIIFLDSAQGC